MFIFSHANGHPRTGGLLRQKGGSGNSSGTEPALWELRIAGRGHLVHVLGRLSNHLAG